MAMRALLLKELRSARPFLILVLFFAALNWGFLLLSEFPDQYPLSELLSEEARSSGQMVMFILGYALAAGLLVRERDEGTLAFLDGLPVSRVRVFFGKCLVALGVLWLLPLLDFVFNLSVYSLSRTSLDHRFQLGLLVTASLLDAFSCLVFLCVGLALSFLRRYGLLVLGLLFWVYLLLRELQVPGLELLNLFSVGNPVFQGQRWLIPVQKLAAQLALAVVCGAIALAGFLALGETTQRLVGRISRRRGVGLLTALAGVGIAGVWISLAVYFALQNGESSDPAKVTYLPWATARARTGRYQFVYPENQAGFVGPLLDRADEADGRVRAFLGADPMGLIAANLTGSGPRTAGQAHWKSVEMDLAAAGGKLEELLAVLGHETAHVYIDHLSQMRLSEQFNSTRFFHEGLATYVEYHFFRSPDELRALRRVAATMRARREVMMDELLDNNRLRTARDSDLAYPLGEVFVAALVQAHGESGPGQVVKAFARPDAPAGLDGFELWRDVFQALGWNFDEVVGGFFAELDRAVAEHQSFIDALPRLRGAVQQGSDRIGIRPVFAGRAPGRVVCRFRPRPDTEERFYEVRWGGSGDVLDARAAGYLERSFWYQLGWSAAGASQPIYESWVEVRRQ